MSLTGSLTSWLVIPGSRPGSGNVKMAFRMQTSVPELADLSKEPKNVHALHGPESKTRGSFANSALMARRLLERGVRFVQIFHRGWDQHSNLPRDMVSQCKDIDQGCYGLIQDLKQRGMLEYTLVVRGGEFGRAIYSQGTLTDTDYGRDHHPRCFSMWLAGGGVKPGQISMARPTKCRSILSRIRSISAICTAPFSTPWE